ncbi:hypothetical protein [Melittangium boletus]|uniref:Uncharacterized protein n=1 Tax=Melittangium boletus DSM 14713 TaxID=1294270 RepID=A0A250I9D7_9BACT|nr:hypothetical protein [Melittangium boletus]ATB28484.1 hypothetical protein MEBOL_001931 [Melittangium boletus DSM 14713]
MNAHVTAVAKRIKAINWAGSFDKTPSRVALLREYLRRASWWAEAVKSAEWPFFDIAAGLNPAVRADPTQVQAIEAHLSVKLQGLLVVRTCVRALHFAALLDAGAKLPRVPPSVEQPFEPLLMMFERGGGFRLGGSGLIEVDTAGVPKGTAQSHHTDKPVVTLEPAALDALDAGA